MLIPIGVAWSVHRAMTWRAAPGMAPLVALAVLLLLGALIASKSVGACVAVILAIVIYGLPFKRVFVPVVAVATVAVIMNLGPRIDMDAYRSFSDRLGFAKIAVQGLSSMPLVGGGLGTTSLTAGFFQPPLGTQIVNKIHNDWLELLFCTGIAGLILLAGLFIVGNGIFRLYGKDFLVRAGMTGALLTVGLHSLVDFPVQNYTLMAFAAFFAGFLARLAFSGDQVPRRGPNPAVMLALILASLGVVALMGAGLVRVRQGRASAWQVARSMPLIRNDLRAAQKLLARHGLMAPLWGELALAQEQAHRFPEASTSIGNAIDLQPTNPKLYQVAARLSYLQDDGDRYLEYLTKAVALDYVNPNEILPLSKEQTETLVISAARQAYRYYGVGAATHYRLGYSLLLNIGAPRRLELIEEGAKLFPDSESILSEAGEESLASGKLAQARVFAGRALALSSSPMDAVRLARVEAASGNLKEALAGFYRALELSSSAQETTLIISWAPIYLQGLTLQEIIEFSRAGYGRFPNPPSACLIGGLYSRAGMTQEAVRWYDLALQLDPRTERAYQELLPLLTAKGDMNRLRIYVAMAQAYFRGTQWLQPYLQAAGAPDR